jgi:hypothetical protein
MLGAGDAPENFSILEALLGLARRHDDRVARDIEGLLGQARASELAVVVAGQFKRGKTTFVNALLGANALPTGVLPVTSVPTIIRHGPRRAIVHFLDGREEQVAIENVARYVTEAANPGNQLSLERVEVALEAPRLAGLAIVDTPGIGSIFAQGTKAAKESVRRADLAILVIGPEPPIGAAEAAFAVQLRYAAERMFVVFNKADQAGAALDEHLAFARDALEAALGEAPPLYALSARAPEEEPFAAFFCEFERFVSARRAELLSRSIGRRSAVIASSLAQHLALERGALMLPVAARHAVQVRFSQLAGELHERARDAELTLERGARDDLTEVEMLLDRLIRDARERLHGEILAMIVPNDSDAAFGWLRARLEQTSQAWSQSASALAQARLQARFERFAERAAGIESEMRAGGLACVGLPDALAEIDRPAPDLPTARFAYDEQPTTGLEVAGQGALRLLPLAIRRRRVRAGLVERLDSALDGWRGRVRYALAQAIERERRNLTAAVGRRLADAEAGVSAALARAKDAGDDESRRARESELAREERLARELGRVLGSECREIAALLDTSSSCLAGEKYRFVKVFPKTRL